MNILRVANILDNRTGGMARWMYSTGDLLTESGHRVDYLFAPGIGPCRSRFAGRFLLPWRVAARVADLHKRQGPYDVVEVHEPIAMWCGLRQRWDRSFPTIVVICHGLEARSHQTAIAYRKSKGIPVSLKQRISPLTVVWQANVGLRSAAAVLCLNNEDRDHLIAEGIPMERVHLIPIGVREVFLQAGAAAPAADRRGQLLFLGTWLERKGILDLVPAAVAILNRFPDARLTVAGCLVAPEVVRETFPANLRGRIEVISKVANDDQLVRLYRQHQVFLLPSVFEGMPQVMLEAAAMKLVIVSTSRCGMKDFLRDGENGLLVPPGDPGRLISALARLYTEPGLAERLGDSAHGSAWEYTMDRAARLLLTGYEAAARDRPVSPPIAP
jgi:glycosyltransferase involved in cell wall biosynthesis